MNMTTEELQIEPTYLPQVDDDVARAVIRCVAAWADRYRAWRSDYPSMIREGELPHGADLEPLLNDLFTWASGKHDDVEGNARHLGLVLYRGEELVLAQVDARVPERIVASSEQFDRLQSCLRLAGVPPDLYYPTRQQRQVIEPVEARIGTDDLLGVVRAKMTYSPRQWALRDEEAVKQRRVPTEDEREQTFANACQAFLRALHLRLRELTEPDGASKTRQYLTELEIALQVTQLLIAGSVGREDASEQFRSNLLRKVEQYSDEIRRDG
jgi:hypothetical protein